MAFDRHDPTQLSRLKTEITTDPRKYGYATPYAAKDNVATSRLINTARDGTNPPQTPTGDGGQADGKIQLNRGTVPRNEVLDCLVQTDYPSNAVQQGWLGIVLTYDPINVSTNSNVRAGLLNIFGPTTVTRANFITVSLKFASRSEEMFGVGTFISSDDIQACRY
jgi:hypothetical protein